MHELTQARRVLEVFGPGHVLLIGADTGNLAIELRRLGCRVTPHGSAAEAQAPAGRDLPPFDVVLSSWGQGFDWQALEGLRQRRGISRLVLIRAAAQRALPANVVLAHAVQFGWRRSVSAWSMQHYGDLDRPQAWTELFLEALPDGRQTVAPPNGLSDPTLASGPWPDAQLARYAKAAEFVRPGDRVVVVGAGCGAGAALIAHRSRCRTVLALEEREAAVDYARRHFGTCSTVTFRASTPGLLEGLTDHEADLVVALDVFDSCAAPAELVEEFKRALKPDGRIVASVAEVAGSTQRGDDLQARLARDFLVEARFRQALPDNAGTPRTVDPLRLEEPVPAGGWRIVVAAANPLGSAGLAFTHPEFERTQDSHAVAVTSFGDHYENPWLYRPLVQMGQRLHDEQVLTELALDVLERASAASADHGAALCVLAYRVLGKRQLEQVANLLPLIDAYGGARAANPHVARWQISLDFAAALLCLTIGDLDGARARFGGVTRRDPMAFSPLLSTKTVASWFWLGVLQTVDRQMEQAQASFEAGCRTAARALQSPIEQSIGSLSRPNTFGFQEIAEVADMASQCAQAIDALPYFAASPGRFWRQVDTRRFGLATWLLHLERENRELREQLQGLEKGARSAA